MPALLYKFTWHQGVCAISTRVGAPARIAGPHSVTVLRAVLPHLHAAENAGRKRRAIGRGRCEVQPRPGVGKGQRQHPVGCRQTGQRRGLTHNVRLAVDFVFGQQGQAAAHRLFFLGVDVVLHPHIGGHSQRGAGYSVRRVLLGSAHNAVAFAGTLHPALKRGQLYKQEGQFPPPQPPPISDQGRKQRFIRFRVGIAVRLALVPDHPADAVGRNGLDH